MSTMPYADEFRIAARRKYEKKLGADKIMIDGNSHVQEVTHAGGAWVTAILWVNKEDVSE